MDDSDAGLPPDAKRLGDVLYTFGGMDPAPIWRRDMGALAAGLRRDAGALRRVDAPGLTGVRLAAMADALDHNARTYAELFEEVGLALDPDVAPATSAPWMLATSVSTMRDWAWEPRTDENQAALGAVLAVWPGAKGGRVLVLGAGAGRLGVDLHVATGAARTVLLDVNPLPLLVAARVLRGDPLRLYELPRNPTTAADAAIARDLRSPHAATGITLVVADGRKPPFTEPFDAVITPWYIDQVEQPLPALLAALRRVLRPGGVWINHGPLIYDRRPIPAQFTLEELLGLIREAGFTIGDVASHRMPHLHAPGSTHGRIETVHTFTARP